MADENINPESVRELNEQLKSLTEILGKQAEQTKLLNRELQDEDIKRSKLIKDLSASAIAEDRLTAAKLKGVQAYEAQLHSLGLVKDSLGNFNRVTTELTKKQRDRLAKEKAISDQYAAKEEFRQKISEFSTNKASKSLDALAGAGKLLNKTVFDSARGQGKYGELLGSFGDGIIDVTSKLGPLGKGIGLVAGGLFKLFAAGLKQNEELNKAYENLSQLGQVDAGGIQQMFTNLQNAGMTVGELDKFQDVMKSASDGLAFMGTSAAQGAKNLSETFGKTLNTETERQLKSLGYTNEKALKTFADYNTYMAKLGLTQGKNQNQLNKESVEYAKTLDELAKLTGMERDELAEKQRRAAQDVKFRLVMAEASEEQQKQYSIMATLASRGGEEMAAGVREMIANGGAIVGQASEKLALQTSGQATQIIQELQEGRIDAVEASRRIALATKETISSMSDAGKLSSEITNTFGITAETMEFTNLFANKSQADIEQLRKDALKQQQSDNDAQRQAEVQRQKTERNAEQAKDKFTQLIGKGLAPAFEKLMEIVNKINASLAKFVKIITFGVVDLTDAFSEKGEAKGAAASAAGGAPKSLLDKIIQVESGGNAKAQAGTSSAYGLGQFTKGTFEDLAKRKDSAVYGKSWQDYKDSPDIQRQALEELTKRNQNYLATKGIATTDTATYLAHFLGAGGVTKLYQAGNEANLADVIDPAAMKANSSVFKNLSTVKDLKEWAARKMGEDLSIATAASGGIFAGPSSGYPVMLHGREVVIPMPENKDIASLLGSVDKQELPTSAPVTSAAPNTTEAFQSLYNLMSEKLDAIVDKLATGNDIQNDLLKHSRV